MLIQKREPIIFGSLDFFMPFSKDETFKKVLEKFALAFILSERQAKNVSNYEGKETLSEDGVYTLTIKDSDDWNTHKSLYEKIFDRLGIYVVNLCSCCSGWKCFACDFPYYQ